MAWLHTLEVVVCLLMLFGIFFLITREDGKVEMRSMLIKIRAWNTLKVLDDFGQLGYYATKNDTVKLKELMKDFLPGIKFDIKICGEECELQPKSLDVIRVSYIIPGYENFNPKEIILTIW